MKICINANIMKTQLNVTFMLLFIPSDLITTLNFVLMDIFCPCLFQGFGASENSISELFSNFCLFHDLSLL